MTQQPPVNWLTQAVIESVDEAMDILRELFGVDGEFELGLLEIDTPQEDLRKRFEEVAMALGKETGMQFLYTRVAGCEKLMVETSSKNEF